MDLLKQVPDYQEYFDNKLYNTAKAKLLAYAISGAYCPTHGPSRIGVFFKGIYKAGKGNYFCYGYKNETKARFLFPKICDNVKYIIPLGKEFPLEAFKSYAIKLVKVEDEIEIIEA